MLDAFRAVLLSEMELAHLCTAADNTDPVRIAARRRYGRCHVCDEPGAFSDVYLVGHDLFACDPCGVRWPEKRSDRPYPSEAGRQAEAAWTPAPGRGLLGPLSHGLDDLGMAELRAKAVRWVRDECAQRGAGWASREIERLVTDLNHARRRAKDGGRDRAVHFLAQTEMLAVFWKGWEEHIRAGAETWNKARANREFFKAEQLRALEERAAKAEARRAREHGARKRGR